jgi:threonine dehydrogenase-like Zn-dependent dehydrogenase
MLLLQAGYFSGCERSNPDKAKAEKLWGHSPVGLFGYSHLLGGYPGGQAEDLRVPFADVGPVKVPAGLSDEQVLFLSDIFPTGYMAADFCDIENDDTVAAWGCGPVGQFAIRSAFLLGAGRVIAIATLPEARHGGTAGAETLDFMKEDIYGCIQELTSGRGADACIDAVGTEPHSTRRQSGCGDQAEQRTRRSSVATFLRREPTSSVKQLDDLPIGVGRTCRARHEPDAWRMGA